MRTRGKDGKFTKTQLESEEDNQNGNGFLGDFKSLFTQFYKLWRVLPILLLVFLLWRYFKISSRFYELLIELSCGENCRCVCEDGLIKATNNTIAQQSSGNTKKDF